MKNKGICAAIFAALLLCVAACAVWVHTLCKEDNSLSLFWAADRNNVVEAWLLIQSGVDVNATFEQNTALVRAAHENAAAVARLLIKSGADVNAKRYDGKTALMYATEGKATEVMELLKAAGASF